MTDVLQWMVDLPRYVLPILQEIVDFLTQPLYDTIFVKIMTSWPLLGNILQFPLQWFKTLFPDMSWLDVMLGPGLIIILMLSIIKWIIGIVT